MERLGEREEEEVSEAYHILKILVQTLHKGVYKFQDSEFILHV